MKNVSRLIVAIITLLIIASLSTFTVDQREHAVVFRLGEIVSVKGEPGLYVKVPLVDNVRFFDKRILTYDSSQPDRFIRVRRRTYLLTPTSNGVSLTLQNIMFL